jgi:protoporphyrinogen oxidase
LSDEEIARRVKEDLSNYGIPMATAPLFTRVYRWPQAVCRASGGMLKAVNAMRQTEQTGCQGLFLAGEYTRLASVNGALSSGMGAAEEATGFLRAGR